MQHVLYNQCCILNHLTQCESLLNSDLPAPTGQLVQLLPDADLHLFFLRYWIIITTLIIKTNNPISRFLIQCFPTLILRKFQHTMYQFCLLETASISVHVTTCCVRYVPILQNCMLEIRQTCITVCLTLVCLPNCGINVGIKIILHKPPHDTWLSNPCILRHNIKISNKIHKPIQLIIYTHTYIHTYMREWEFFLQKHVFIVLLC